jgi:uncharacterized protein YdaU (DUF1376 family)
MSRSKDPAFLFYTSDFLSGVQDLTMEERGQYITLLCLQHQKGHMSDKLIALSVGNAAADVMAKFRQDSAGLWYNERLDEEIEKRRIHGMKQRERAIEGWKKRKTESDSMPHESGGNAAALPLEDVNVNEDVNRNGSKKGVQGEADILSDESLSMIFDEGTMERYQMTFRQIDVKEQLEKFILKVRGSPLDYKHRGTGGIRNAFQYQLEHAKPLKINGSKTHQSNTSGPKNPTAKTFGTL